MARRASCSSVCPAVTRHQIGEVLGFGIRARDSHIAGMTAISAAEIPGSALQHDDARACLGRTQSGA